MQTDQKTKIEKKLRSPGFEMLSWLKKGELNHGDKNSFPGTAPKDGRLLARGELPSRSDRFISTTIRC
jgi:hypothetical protein